MALTPKRKHIPESGFGIQRNFFSVNNMAERVGFETVLKRQTKDLAEHGQQSKSL
jgi:hypothetical protein